MLFPIISILFNVLAAVLRLLLLWQKHPLRNPYTMTPEDINFALWNAGLIGLHVAFVLMGLIKLFIDYL
jgi:hypothetical protein